MLDQYDIYFENSLHLQVVFFFFQNKQSASHCLVQAIFFSQENNYDTRIYICIGLVDDFGTKMRRAAANIMKRRQHVA